ncbi:hypothetical protein Dsin_000954 [Dipteronia sinensis]|uniref:Uncharacterized protein n=1 Tax=Dipteronia sinensis TaxID=43782 RepID=A0AAE0EHW7_9ROSI|nr:hypothetical protein Dsin_000954 [Dipteronia sinensis]
MDMENINERKKRKMENEEEEEENEEEKMEQFYALLRNTKDVRDRLRSTSISSTGLHGSPIPSIPSMEINNNNNNNKQDQEKKKQLEEKALSAVWNPSFQPEDFMEDRNVIAKSNTVNLGSTSSTQLAASQEEKEEEPQQQQQQQEEDDKKDGGNDNNNLDLDLNLSL